MYKNQINKEKVNKPMINNYKKVSDKITQCLILKIKKKCYNYKMRKCIGKLKSIVRLSDSNTKHKRIKNKML